MSHNKLYRIKWLDMLKAYAIFLVFIGHKIDQFFIEQIIYAFHIPLFFWISGYIYDKKKYKAFKYFLIKKIKTLVLPYLIFSLTSYFFWYYVVRTLSVRGQALTRDPLLPFLGILYGVGVEPWRNPLDVALWFLPCLFITEIFFWLINRYSNKNIRSIIVLVFGIFGYCSSIWLPFRLPWSIDVALTAVLFFYIGNISKDILNSLNTIRLGWKALITFLLFIIILILAKANGKADMNYNHYGNFFLFLIGALAGIYFSILITKNIPTPRIISYIGQNTIVLVGLGGVSSFFISGIYYLVTGTISAGGKISIIDSIIDSCLEIFFLLPVIYVIKNYTPFIIV